MTAAGTLAPTILCRHPHLGRDSHMVPSSAIAQVTGATQELCLLLAPPPRRVLLKWEAECEKL